MQTAGRVCSFQCDCVSAEEFWLLCVFNMNIRNAAVKFCDLTTCLEDVVNEKSSELSEFKVGQIFQHMVYPSSVTQTAASYDFHQTETSSI